MMEYKKWGKFSINAVLVSVVAMGAIGCTSFHYLEPDAPTQTQQVRYVSGYPAISEIQLEMGKEYYYGVAVFGYTISDNIVLDVYYENATTRPINVIPDSITVIGYRGDVPHSLKVHESNEYIRRVRRKQNTAIVLQAIGGALEDADAGYSTEYSSGTYSGSYSGSSYGSYSGSYSGYSQTYDADAAAAARAQTSAELATRAEANSDNLEYLNTVLLKRTTLNPGYYISGLVYVNRDLYDHYTIVVPFGDSEFEFSFDLVELE